MRTSMLYIARLVNGILPETRCFGFKRWLYRRAGVEMGKNVRICSSAMIIGSGKLTIGDNTWIGPRCLISASSSIKIGRDCDIAPNVFIGTGTHEITPQMHKIGAIEISKDITIGDGCWLCANSCITAGVSVGDKSVVAAGGVATKEIPPYTLAGGVPAGCIKPLNHTS